MGSVGALSGGSKKASEAGPLSESCARIGSTIVLVTSGILPNGSENDGGIATALSVTTGACVIVLVSKIIAVA
ncbi:unnamed protein product [Lasius platythorax]|uniref:Uncharacterized protein n=1 Tax=Lasius platythorax TaxID=488582 RepID=A0AAV2MVN4_9HYME